MTSPPPQASLRPITCAEPGSFANGVVLQRHPAIVGQVLEDRPCDATQTAELTRLAEESVSGVITQLPEAAADSRYWQSSGHGLFGRPWTEAPFLWAESYFYRRLLQALGFHEPGPWRGIDPFEAMKGRELVGGAVTEFLGELGQVSGATEREMFLALLRAALLGNRADLGFRMSVPASQAASDGGVDLIVDHGEAIWEHVRRSSPRRVLVLADNAGLEVLADLLLCDFLIDRCGCAAIAMHVKPAPYYVSDATAGDVVAALRRLRQGGPEARDACGRLMDDVRTDRLGLRADAFSCLPEHYWAAPPGLWRELADADLVISKGDLNYRRLVGDVEQDPAIPFEEACAYFPSPVVALRTLKSDVAVGIDPATLARLEATGENWRTDGTRGVIQARLT
jgi:uncharacterized protein with ATP-grasp and redox domains